MSTELSDFIRSVFKKQPIILTYKGLNYHFTLYKADLNNRVAAEYFFQTVKMTVTELLEEDSNSVELLMKLYMRLKSSTALNSKVPRIIRRGERTFDIRTLSTRTAKSKFKEHITFSQLSYPSKVQDESERYKYFVGKQKLQEGSNPETNNLFEKAIYIKDVIDTEINENEYFDYLDVILQKLNDWEKFENKFIEGKTAEELDSILEGRGRQSIRELHDKFMKVFKNEFSNSIFQKLYFNLEGLYHWFWENIFLSVFMEINPLLNEIEKRAYILYYTRQEYMDYHIPAFEYFTEEFFKTLNENEQIELIYTLLISTGQERAELNESYDKKFTDFLKFYPLWMDIMRLDENMTDEEISLIRYKGYVPKMRSIGTSAGETTKADFDSLFELIPNTENQYRLEDGMPAEDDIGRKYDDEHLLDLINTRLSPKEREVIELLYFGDKKYTQTTVSKKLGISQSAINQRLRSAISKLRISY